MFTGKTIESKFYSFVPYYFRLLKTSLTDFVQGGVFSVTVIFSMSFQKYMRAMQ